MLAHVKDAMAAESSLRLQAPRCLSRPSLFFPLRFFIMLLALLFKTANQSNVADVCAIFRASAVWGCRQRDCLDLTTDICYLMTGGLGGVI
jgi:hypothetical protein